MQGITRRSVLQAGASAGLAALAGTAAAEDKSGKKPATDRERVMAAGLTAEEADCWEAVAEAAGKFFALPKLHPMDAQEVASAIHIIQNKLLSRPTYRRYLEISKESAK
jgi:hypothetical protein